MSIFSHFQGRFEATRQEEYSLQEYLEICKKDRTAFASAAERMLMAIGEPELVDTTSDSRLSRIFSNKVIRRYPAFADFHGMEDCIEQIVSYFRHAAQGLEEKKQILYLLGPVGGGKSSLAEKLKHLIEKVPFYAIKGSPVFESPLGLFNPDEDGQILEEDYGIPRHYLRSIMSPWAAKRLQEFGGDISKFRVVKLYPSILNQIAIAKTEPGDENNQDISALVGKVDIRKLEEYPQNDADAYSYSGALCRANQGLMGQGLRVRWRWREATLAEAVHNLHQSLDGDRLVAVDDDGGLAVGLGLRLKSPGQLGQGQGLAIELQIAAGGQGDDGLVLWFELHGAAGAWQLGLDAQGGNHVEADEYEKHQQEHHHIDHRNEFDMGFALLGFVPGFHGRGLPLVGSRRP